MKKICYITTIVGTLGFLKKQMDYMYKNGYDVYAICSYREDYKEKIGENVKFISINTCKIYFRFNKGTKKRKI